MMNRIALCFTVLATMLVLAAGCKKDEKDWSADAAGTYVGRLIVKLEPVGGGTETSPISDEFPLSTITVTKHSQAKTVSVDLTYAFTRNLREMIFKQSSSDAKGASYQVEAKEFHPSGLTADYSEIRVIRSQSASFNAEDMEFSFVLEVEATKQRINGVPLKYAGTMRFYTAKL